MALIDLFGCFRCQFHKCKLNHIVLQANIYITWNKTLRSKLWFWTSLFFGSGVVLTEGFLFQFHLIQLACTFGQESQTSTALTVRQQNHSTSQPQSMQKVVWFTNSSMTPPRPRPLPPAIQLRLLSHLHRFSLSSSSFSPLHSSILIKWQAADVSICKDQIWCLKAAWWQAPADAYTHMRIAFIRACGNTHPNHNYWQVTKHTDVQ